jgi:nucleotide-binding universal stress UspA family protein
MYSHILITTDGSEIAQKGVEQGLDAAKAFGAKVTIMAVVESTIPYIAGAGDISPSVYQEYAERQRRAAEAILTAAQAEARNRGVSAETIWVEQGPPAQAIVETAQARNCDLIAMSSHGRRGLRRMILGSVTSEVLVLSTVPVLVVK